MKSSEITDAVRLAMHRAPALRQPSYANQPLPARIPDAKQREQPPALESESKREAQGTGRPHVCFVLRRVKLLDADAKYSSIKDLLDALAYAGAIRGDREDQITLEVLQEKVSHYADESTLISVNYDQALTLLNEITKV